MEQTLNSVAHSVIVWGGDKMGCLNSVDDLLEGVERR